jgi:adenylyltransferase/sulfurtransferase
MSALPFRKPRLPSNYHIWCEPPDDSGDEVLHFVSERKSLKLKGHSFREFQNSVLPLLDGRHSIEDIQKKVEDIFHEEDLVECLQLLAAQNLLEEGDTGLQEEVARRLTPQLNFFHEVGGQAEEMQERLANATVTVLGLGGIGSATALSLAAAGVGTLRCVDALPVRETDVYLSPAFQIKDVGGSRAVAVARGIERCAPQVKTFVHDRAVEREDEVCAVVEGADFVACCLDAGQSNLAFKLNRVCLAGAIRWTSCTVSGFEIILGPTVHPLDSPCYLCYRMRAVACSVNPEDAFAYERYLDHRKHDDSGTRENLAFGVGIAANMVGLEALKELTNIGQPSAVGRIVVFDLLELTCSRHVVLRKPWCPACFGKNRKYNTQEPAQDIGRAKDVR